MKILYVSTVSSTMNAFLIPHIKMLVGKSHQVDLAFKENKPLKKELKDLVTNIYEFEFNRSPIKNNLFKIINRMKKIISEGDYDIVHTHTPIASAIVRLACKDLKNIRVIYTAHGFHFYDGAPLQNWILFYPIEKILSRYTDLIITINKEDYKIATKKFSSNSVKYIPGIGFDYNKFNNTRNLNKRKEIGISNESFVISSVGELNKNKNHKVIIEALSKLNNPDIHYIIAGEGQLRNDLNLLIKSLKLQKNVHLLGFRNDIPEILASSDTFAFPSFREGLGISALEAMATGLPILTSNVHGITDYSINGVTGLNYNPNDIEGFAYGINKILNLTQVERNKISLINRKTAQSYDVSVVLNKMDTIYNSF